MRSKQADRGSKEGARLYLSFKHQRGPGNAFSMGPCQGCGCEDAGWGLRRARRGNGIGFMQHFARRKRYLYWNKGETHEPCCCVQSSFLREEFEEWFARTGRYSSRRGGPDVQGWPGCVFLRARTGMGQNGDKILGQGALLAGGSVVGWRSTPCPPGPLCCWREGCGNGEGM